MQQSCGHAVLFVAACVFLCIPCTSRTTTEATQPCVGLNLQLRGGGPHKIKAQVPFRIPHTPNGTQKLSSVRLKEMQEDPTNPAVMKQGCRALRRVCLNAEKQHRMGKHKGACKALIVTLQNHVNSTDVMREALGLAVNLAYAQPKNPFGLAGWAHIDNQDEIGRMGGVRYVIGALCRHKQSAELAETGVRALANLVYNHTENRQRCVKFGGIPAALAAMALHPEELRVQDAGCLFVWSVVVSIVGETHVTWGLEHTGAPAGGKVDVDLAVAGSVAESGGVELLVAALRRFGTHSADDRDGVNIAEQASAALYMLAAAPGRLREEVKKRGAEAGCRRAIKAQAEIAPARTWAARLLQLLSGSDMSHLFMPIQVPGEDVGEHLYNEFRDWEPRCAPYCGCHGWNLPNASEIEEELGDGERMEDGEDDEEEEEEEEEGEGEESETAFEGEVGDDSEEELLKKVGGSTSDSDWQRGEELMAEEAREDFKKEKKKWGSKVGRFKDRDAERKKKREAYEEKRRKYNAKAKK